MSTNHARRTFQFPVFMVAISTLSTAFALPSGGALPDAAVQGPMFVKKYEPGSLDLPLGAHLIPGSTYVLFVPGKAADVPLVGALFGIVGIAVMNEVGKADTATLAEGSKPKLPDLTGLAREQFLKHGASAAGDRPVFEIIPSGWFVVHESGEKAKLVIQLQVEWHNRDGDAVWLQKYAYQSAERPLAGNEGWFATDGSLLLNESTFGISNLGEIFLKDRARTQTYAETEVKLGSCFPGARKLTLLAETGSLLLVRRRGNSATGETVHLVRRAECEIVR